MTESRIVKVGKYDDPESETVRIVHISDTHLKHNEFLPQIPDGDILIHSGDFAKFNFKKFLTGTNHEAVLESIDQFFSALPHRHKIFVAGNHETTFNHEIREEIQRELHHVHYLQDRSITCEGLKIYGSPWNSKRWTSYARGFTESWGKFEQNWDKIPSDTDVLVTHMPPQGIMDLAHIKFPMFTRQKVVCDVCGSGHRNLSHWGCRSLKKVVFDKVRPLLHLYGHVHESSGILKLEDITFSNAALPFYQKANVFDIYKSRDDVPCIL